MATTPALIRRAAALLAAALLAAGCSDGGGDEVSAEQLLADARRTFDAAQSVHVELTATDVPKGSTAVLGGSGDLARPDSFDGSVTVQTSGLTADIDVVSVGGTVYLKLPLSNRFTPADPRQYGVGDPADLIATDTGISTLLTSTTEAKLLDRARVDGTVVQPIEVTLPGEQVDRLLPSKDPSADVKGVVEIDPETKQVLRVGLTAPFYDAESLTTFTVVLSDYDKPVTVTTPPAA